MAYFCRKGDWVLYFNIHTLSLIVSLAFWEKTFFFRNVKYESSSYTIAATQNDWVALKLYYPDSRINVRAHFFLCPRYSTMESFACGLGTREKLIWVQDKVANDGFFICATRQAIDHLNVFNYKDNLVTRVVLLLLTFLPFVFFIFYWPHVSGFLNPV